MRKRFDCQTATDVLQNLLEKDLCKDLSFMTKRTMSGANLRDEEFQRLESIAVF